ncbi:Bacterial regulatory protein, ArsR family [Desulforapulum autotrophicum HRM2]|uniref:Bacterial regulatory protein, ArsR family n=1 Tax=Desulforapulum autotrophicum (strain ATCC 43914 / DSM 3382 / VKM B-1955 / HRM2) TaxID=177437 RepID=C0QF79_DESAH|nr:metalloregulator ArsR/SmtB family transcription factor [Desulforapulum autotrophicum]ACN17580.1 Bacterial regulatory protein, ArsR family [Desulforapulum autotrophicum HRM2]
MDRTLLILKSLSDKNRLRVFSALMVHNELCACQITELLNVAGATASRHLSLMVNAGVLKNRKQGRWIYFCLNRENPFLLPLFEWVKERVEGSKQFEQDLETLKEILAIACEELSCKQRKNGRNSKS